MVLAKSLQGRTYKKRPRTKFGQKQPTVKTLARQVKAVRNEGQALNVEPFSARPYVGVALVANTVTYDANTIVDSAYYDIFKSSSTAGPSEGDRLIRAHFNIAWDNVAAGSTNATCRLILFKDNQADRGALPVNGVLVSSNTYSEYSGEVYPTYLGIKRNDSRLTNAGSYDEYRYEIMYDKNVVLSDSGMGENKVWEVDVDFYGAKRDQINIKYHFMVISDSAAEITVTGNYVFKKTGPGQS